MSARPVDVSVEPGQLEIRRCLADTVVLKLGNSGSHAAYVELTIAADDPLQPSRDALATVLPPGYAQSVAIRIAVPEDAPAGNYALRIAPRGPAQFGRLAVPVTVPDVACVPRSQITATATSAQVTPDYAPRNAIDGVESTLWHTRYSPAKDPLPQSITLALGGAYDLSELAYQPRLDGNLNGVITSYVVHVSADGEQFAPVASGSWAADATLKSARLDAPAARFVRLEATAGSGGFASAAEIVLFTA